MFKRKKVIIYVALVIAILFLGIMTIYLFFYGEIPEVHTSISEYGEWDDFDGYSGLKIFPTQLANAEIQEYYYFSQDVLEAPKCQIYLQVKYDDTTYEKEVLRLKNINIVRNEQNKNVIWNDFEKFVSTAYICEYAWNNCYEYALIFDDMNTVVYIFLQNIEEKDVVFNKIFMPIKYGEERESYCIYGFGNGKNVMIYE